MENVKARKATKANRDAFYTSVLIFYSLKWEGSWRLFARKDNKATVCFSNDQKRRRHLFGRIEVLNHLHGRTNESFFWRWDEVEEHCDVKSLCSWLIIPWYDGTVKGKLEETPLISNWYFSCKYYMSPMLDDRGHIIFLRFFRENFVTLLNPLNFYHCSNKIGKKFNKKRQKRVHTTGHTTP